MKIDDIIDIENAIICFTSYKGREISRITTKIYESFVESDFTDAYQYAMIWIEDNYKEVPA